MSTTRPLVVLLGWLGCQPKNLRRYEALYQGFEIVTRVATPAQVVRAVLTQPNQNNNVKAPHTWPYSSHQQPYNSNNDNSNNNVPQIHSAQQLTVEDLAWDILAEMEESEAPVVFLHIFSNGGGFVWEALLRILAARDNNYPGPVQQRLAAIEQRLAGVIVDSAPSVDLHRLADALAWVSWRDKLDMLLWQAEPAWLYHWWWKWNSPVVQESLQQRCKLYLQAWTEPAVARRIPMLFLYSQNDPLCSPVAIQNIVQTLPHAQSVCWQDSIHCGHLLRHAADYQTAVQDFVQTNLTKPDNSHLRSKL